MKLHHGRRHLNTCYGRDAGRRLLAPSNLQLLSGGGCHDNGCYRSTHRGTSTLRRGSDGSRSHGFQASRRYAETMQFFNTCTASVAKKAPPVPFPFNHKDRRQDNSAKECRQHVSALLWSCRDAFAPAHRLLRRARRPPFPGSLTVPHSLRSITLGPALRWTQSA